MRKSRSNNTVAGRDGKHRIAHWLRHHHYAIKNAGKALIRNRWAVTINTVILGLSLALPLALLSVTNHFAYFVDTFYAPHRLFIELEKEASQSDTESFIASLEQDVRVAELHFLSRDDVLKRVADELNLEHNPQIAALNPFSDSLAVGLTGGTYAEKSVARIVKELEANALVVRVDISRSFSVGGQFELHERLRRFALILSSIVLISVLLVCGYMVRNQILRQYLEIEVSRYCGAENAFIRRPFLYWGAAQGFLGGVCAGVIVFLCAALLKYPGSDIAGVNSSREPLSLIFLPELAQTLGVATLLGFIGAWLASARQADLRSGTSNSR